MRCKLATIVFVISSYWTTFIEILFFGYIVIICYFDSNISHSLIFTILWYIQLLTVTVYTPALVYTGVVFMYLLPLYLKIRFKQVLGLIDIYYKNSKFCIKSIQIVYEILY
jgi:hypothetical protein